MNLVRRSFTTLNENELLRRSNLVEVNIPLCSSLLVEAKKPMCSSLLVEVNIPILFRSVSAEPERLSSGRLKALLSGVNRQRTENRRGTAPSENLS